MSDPFIGEIRMFGGNFAPRGWALCDGQLLAITKNTALFSILGTTYGGDGRTTFGMPDLRGRFPMHPGSAPGLSPHKLGDKRGLERVNLSVSEMPKHRHAAQSASYEGNSDDPREGVVAATNQNTYSTEKPNSLMQKNAIGSTGGSQSHENMPPYQCVNFIIALEGLFPSRS